MQNSIKLFFSAFAVTLAFLTSLICIYKIYSSCEQVISGNSCGFLIQKAEQRGKFYLKAGTGTYLVSLFADNENSLSFATKKIKAHSAELPEAISAIYYAKQTLDELLQ